MKPRTAIGLLLFTTVLGACETPAPRVDASFGKSLNHMLREQIYDPQAASRATPLPSADGQRLEKLLQSHREDVVHASEQVAKPVQSNTGNH